MTARASGPFPSLRGPRFCPPGESGAGRETGGLSASLRLFRNPKSSLCGGRGGGDGGGGLEGTGRRGHQACSPGGYLRPARPRGRDARELWIPAGAGGHQTPGSRPHLLRPPQEAWHLSWCQLCHLPPSLHPGEPAACGDWMRLTPCLLITPFFSASRLTQPSLPWGKACPSDTSPACSR